jgi:site-specific DNA-adenine methylase
MFRFNAPGNFNISYGKIAYNTKDFRKKVQNIFSNKTQRLLKNTTIENIDFEKLFNKYKFTDKDFIFLNPPHNTDFSDYEKNPFTKKRPGTISKMLNTNQREFYFNNQPKESNKKIYSKPNKLLLTHLTLVATHSKEIILSINSKLDISAINLTEITYLTCLFKQFTKTLRERVNFNTNIKIVKKTVVICVFSLFLFSRSSY